MPHCVLLRWRAYFDEQKADRSSIETGPIIDCFRRFPRTLLALEVKTWQRNWYCEKCLPHCQSRSHKAKKSEKKPPPRANCDVERRPRWQTERRLLTVFDILWHHFSSPIYLLPSFGRGLIMSFLESTFPPSNTWGHVTPRHRRSSPMWLKVTLEPSCRIVLILGSAGFKIVIAWEVQYSGYFFQLLYYYLFEALIIIFDQWQLLLYRCIIFNHCKTIFSCKNTCAKWKSIQNNSSSCQIRISIVML